jgi:AcrR family transcriptional regulator
MTRRPTATSATKKATRRTQAQRRLETQAAILAASLDVLIEQGYAAFSASKVAARAGVSRGAQEHYYPTKTKLIAAATRHAMDEAVAHAKSLAETAARSPDPVAKFLLDSEHFFFNPLFRALIEIMIAARADRALARICHPIVLEARMTLNKIWTETLEEAGYSRASARKFVEITHYLMRGVFVVDTWLPYGIDRTAALADWRRVAHDMLRLWADGGHKNKERSL